MQDWIDEGLEDAPNTKLIAQALHSGPLKDKYTDELGEDLGIKFMEFVMGEEVYFRIACITIMCPISCVYIDGG